MARILALGGCGFIGSYLTRKLLEEGHEVTSVDNFSKYGDIKHDFYTHRNFRLVKKDVRNMDSSEFKDYDDILCIAALIGGIKYFHKIPYRIAKENTQILTQSVDNTLKGSPDATFHYFSSSMVYERMHREVTEEDAVNQLIPVTNYGLQKLFGEFVTRGANQEFGLNYVIVRPFNAVGAGELPEINSKGELDFGMAHVIPDFVYKAVKKQSPFEIMGDGTQVRTFTHAKDIAEAISLMIKKGIKNDDFNICGNNRFSINELAKLIWKKVNKNELREIKYLEAPKDDVKFRVGNSEKAKRLLGWEPKYNMDYILNDTFEFIKTNLKN